MEEEKRTLEEELKQTKSAIALQLSSSGDQRGVVGDSTAQT